MHSCILQEIVSLGEEAHLNTSFKHFVYFIQASVLKKGKFFLVDIANFVHVYCQHCCCTIIYKGTLFQEFELIDKKELAPLQVSHQFC